jgi:predicted TPR repeat methyltransferase
MENSLDKNYFEDVYNKKGDPWDFETSQYEANKYAATLNVLNGAVYKNAFEIGCSIGVFSKMLVAKCQKLLSVDVAEVALQKTKARLKDFPDVKIEKMIIPKQFPSDQFDLIVMSEVGYYFTMPDLTTIKEKIIANLAPNGLLLLVHWTPIVPDYPLTGDIVHNQFIEISGEGKIFKHLINQREHTYRLDLFQKL